MNIQALQQTMAGKKTSRKIKPLLKEIKPTAYSKKDLVQDTNEFMQMYNDKHTK